MAYNTLAQSITPMVLAVQPTINSAASRAASPATGPAYT